MNKTNKNSDRPLSLPQKFMVPCQSLKPTVRKPRQHNLSTLVKTDEEIVLRMHKSVEQFEETFEETFNCKKRKEEFKN